MSSPVLEIDGKPLQQKDGVMIRARAAFIEYQRDYVKAHARRREVSLA